MKMKTIYFLFLLFIFYACHTHRKEKQNTISESSLKKDFRLIDEVKPLIRDGDVIFRNGNDDVSRVARSMNRKDTSFSHCGLLFRENDTVFVYHAIGGIYNPNQKLKREPIDSFCNPKENTALGVYRFSLTTNEKKKLDTVVHNYYKAGLPFDLYFNFQSDDAMYCSEFVFKSLNQSKN
ncbi:MAG TPA: YiiX/YebB-like N1pC/P60 family cysteine hydrolase, partial [Chitinophagaceae bacterium]|nr:YiiX/YebB-like N1pC/P60 family cysteine hydrolase [Chitinophagaceae bacterium]